MIFIDGRSKLNCFDSVKRNRPTAFVGFHSFNPTYLTGRKDQKKTISPDTGTTTYQYDPVVPAPSHTQ